MSNQIKIAWMNRYYGDRWNYFAPVNSIRTQAEENLEGPVEVAESWRDTYLCKINVGKNEILVLHRWALLALSAVPNPGFVGTGLRPIEAHYFYGRFRWGVFGDRTAIDDVNCDPNGNLYNYIPPAPTSASPTQFSMQTKLRPYGTLFGDAPLIIGPGQAVFIKLTTIGDSGIGGTPPPQEPIILNAEMSGYRIPYWPASKDFSIM